MATFEDLLLVLGNSANNPDNLPLLEALDRYNNQPRNVIDIKRTSVANKFHEKQAKLAPNLGLQSSDVFGGSGSNFIDQAEASLYKSAGSLADFGRTFSNYAFNTNYDDSAATGYSNPELADAAAGVSKADRQAIQQKYDQVLTDVAGGNYGSALISALKAAPDALLDSTSSLVEMAAGAAATPLAGAGLGLLAKKVDNAVDAFTGIKKRYKDIEAAQKAANKAGDAAQSAKYAQALKAMDAANEAKKNAVPNMFQTWVNSGAKQAGQASFLTADLMAQQRAEYIEAYGEEPSEARTAGMAVLTLATSMLQFKVAEKLFMPSAKLPKSVAEFRKQLGQEATKQLAAAERGVLGGLVTRIQRGVPSILGAAGGEAAQEYAQFWGGVLGVHMKPDEHTSFMQAMMDVINGTDKQGNKNTDLGIQSALLGAGAGGTLKGVTKTPGLALGVASDTVYNTGKYAAKKAANTAVNALSDSDLAGVSAEYEHRKTATAKFKERLEGQEEILASATKFEDLPENIRSDVLKEAKDKDLTNPDTFKQVQAAVIRDYVQQRTTADIGLAKDRIGEAASRAAELGKRKGKELLEVVGITPEQIDKVVEKAGVYKDITIDAIKKEYNNFPQSTTLALIEGVTEAAADGTKKGLATLVTKARNASPEAMKAMANHVREATPNIATRLDKMAAERIRAQKKAGIDKGRVINSDKVSELVKLASATKQVDDEVATHLAMEIPKLSKGTFDNVSTVKTVRNALKALEASAYFKKLPEAEQKRISDSHKSLDRAFSKAETIPQTVARTAGAVVDSTVDFVDAAVGAIDGIFSGKSKTKAKEAADTKAEEATPKTETKGQPDKNPKQQFVETLNTKINERFKVTENVEDIKTAISALPDAMIAAAAKVSDSVDVDSIMETLSEGLPAINKPEFLGAIQEKVSLYLDSVADKTETKPTGKVDTSKINVVDETKPTDINSAEFTGGINVTMDLEGEVEAFYGSDPQIEAKVDELFEAIDQSYHCGK